MCARVYQCGHSFDYSRDLSAGHITLVSYTLIYFTRLQSGFSAGATSSFLADWLVRILVSALYAVYAILTDYILMHYRSSFIR